MRLTGSQEVVGSNPIFSNSGCGISGGNCDYQGAANNLNNWRVANPNGDINIFSGLYIKRNGNIGLDD